MFLNEYLKVNFVVNINVYVRIGKLYKKLIVHSPPKNIAKYTFYFHRKFPRYTILYMTTIVFPF